MECATACRRCCPRAKRARLVEAQDNRYWLLRDARTGKHPYDNANTFNQITVNQNPITVSIDNNREPIIWGTGFGLRAKVFGYWVRTDWSWGVDDGRWQDRIFNLSLHLDF